MVSSNEEDNLVNETPLFLSNIVSQGISYLESYGWFVLFGIIIFYFLYEKYASRFSQWKQRQQNLKEDEERKKNPDITYEMQVLVEQARTRLQEKVRADSIKKKAEQEQKEEEKRKKRIEEWEAHQEGKGYYSKYKAKDENNEKHENIKPKNKEKLRKPDYNPLTGSSGGSCSYRPGRRMGGG